MHLDSNGNNAPDMRDGYQFITWIGIRGRLFTLKGEQVLRPNYGLDVSGHVDRYDIEHEVLDEVRESLEGLTGLEEVDIVFENEELKVVVV